MNKQNKTTPETETAMAVLPDETPVPFYDSMDMKEEARSIIEDVQDNTGNVWASFNVDTLENKKMMYKCMGTADYNIGDNIGQKINIRDVVIQSVKIIDRATGMPRICPRVSIVDKSGAVFSSTAWGVYNSMKKILTVFGTLHFEEDMIIEIKSITTRNGKSFSLDIVNL